MAWAFVYGYQFFACDGAATRSMLLKCRLTAVNCAKYTAMVKTAYTQEKATTV
jgi:hypothetical protein